MTQTPEGFREKGRDAMKLKLDKDGHAVLQDGMPVYQYEDGTEQPLDAAATVKNFENKISNLIEEKDRHFNDKKKAEEKIKAYGKIDPESAQKHFKLVKQLEGKQLVDEHGLEQYQRQWTEEVTASINEERETERKQWDAEKEEYNTNLKNLNDIVYDLAVTNQFSNHPYFSGDNPKTFYKPDHAAKIFGDKFKVDIGKDRRVKVFAVDADGKTMLSKKNHGEPASFNEAVELIVQSEAEHHDIFRATNRRGPGVGGNLESSYNTPGATGRDKIKAGLSKHFRSI